jgi:hypothetical protein
MNGRGKVLLAAMTLALLLMLLGCGAGDESTGSAESMTKTDFVKKANAICAQADKEISRVYGRYSKKPYPGGKRPTEAVMNRVAEEVVIPARRKQVQRLRALGAPPGEEQRVRRILAAIEEGIEKGEEDRRTLRATGGAEYAFTKALELEVDFGLVKCGLS